MPIAVGSIRSRLPTPLRRAIRIGLVAYVGWFCMLLILENRLIFQPRREPRMSWQPPAPGGGDVRFAAADGTQLTGWYLPHPRPRAHVLFACGNGGNMSYWGEVFRLLHDRLALSVMGFDYRGYGRSEGRPSERGVLQDARAARTKFAELSGIDERAIVLMGRSLGGGVACDLAADGCRALVIESSFTSLPEVAARIYPFLPVRTFMRTRFDSLRKIAAYQGPLLVSHGEADELVPIAMGRQLFDAAPTKLKRFFLVPEGFHNDPQPARYYDELSKFIDELP